MLSLDDTSDCTSDISSCTQRHNLLHGELNCSKRQRGNGLSHEKIDHSATDTTTSKRVAIERSPDGAKFRSGVLIKAAKSSGHPRRPQFCKERIVFSLCDFRRLSNITNSALTDRNSISVSAVAVLMQREILKLHLPSPIRSIKTRLASAPRSYRSISPW